jgi:hypothetical protein
MIAILSASSLFLLSMRSFSSLGSEKALNFIGADFLREKCHPHCNRRVLTDQIDLEYLVVRICVCDVAGSIVTACDYFFLNGTVANHPQSGLTLVCTIAANVIAARSNP